MSLGEMATWLPLPGALPQFCARYVDDAMGFAVGWNVGTPSYLLLLSQRTMRSSIMSYTDLVPVLYHALCRDCCCIRHYPVLGRLERYKCRRLDHYRHRPRPLSQHFRRVDLWRGRVHLRQS